jgi:hypothetical protein
MYPSLSIWERFLQRKPQVYGTIEHTFYAYKIDFSSPALNVIIPSVLDGSSDQNLFTYFGLVTRVGVGAKGQNNIKNVHIRFRLMPLNKKLPEPEVIQIYPSTKSRRIGKTKGVIQKNRGHAITAEAGIKAQAPLLQGIGGGVSASANYDNKNLMSEMTEYELEKEIIISNASGVASRAIWEFYQGQGIAAIGQYNLEIIFRIPRYRKEYANEYCIDWNVEVNGRKLLDHEDELQNEYWNVNVDDRKLMAHETDGGKMNHSILGIEDDKLKSKKEMLRMLNAEDPERKKRLLRPLLIMDNQT